MEEIYSAETGFEAVFCSDLKRSYQTGQLVFKNHQIPIILDKRLRECNYGALNGAPKEQVMDNKEVFIHNKYPNGESYADCIARMEQFLCDLKEKYNFKKVVIIGHRATQFGLECILKKRPIQEVVTETWEWRPGWDYELI